MTEKVRQSYRSEEIAYGKTTTTRMLQPGHTLMELGQSHRLIQSIPKLGLVNL